MRASRWRKRGSSRAATDATVRRTKFSPSTSMSADFATMPLSANQHPAFDDPSPCAALPPKKIKSATGATPTAAPSQLDHLPLELLVRIVCNLHHDQLKPALHVSRRFRQAVLIAQHSHFDFRTPQPDRRPGTLELLTPESPVDARVDADDAQHGQRATPGAPKHPARPAQLRIGAGALRCCFRSAGERKRFLFRGTGPGAARTVFCSARRRSSVRRWPLWISFEADKESVMSLWNSYSTLRRWRASAEVESGEMKVQKALIMLLVTLVCLEAARSPKSKFDEEKEAVLSSTLGTSPRRRGGHHRRAHGESGGSSYGSSSGSSSGPGSGSGYGSGYGGGPGGGGGYGYGYGDSSGNGYGAGAGFVPGHSSSSHNESHYLPPMPVLPPLNPGFD